MHAYIPSYEFDKLYIHTVITTYSYTGYVMTVARMYYTCTVAATICSLLLAVKNFAACAQLSSYLYCII